MLVDLIGSRRPVGVASIYVEAVIAALDEQQAELENLIAGLEDLDGKRPSRCPGWSVADVLLHLAQTSELAAAGGDDSFGERFTRFMPAGARTVDEGAEQAVIAQRGAPWPQLLERWRAAAAAERNLLAGSDPARRLPWVIGELPARTLATTRLSEMWIHTGDIAHALGVTLVPTDRLWHIARLAWRTLPYAFARAGAALHGPVAAELTGPSGAPWSFGAQDQPLTTVRGPAVEFCLVAARRLDPAGSTLTAAGPDSDQVLALLRTYA
ncbi:MAG: maleylpyruvate isomerase family mycothiol-dependent enzyme [Pseudonocardiaceae bacterium]